MNALSHDILIACIEKHCPGCDGSVRIDPIPTGKFNDSFFVTAGEKELVLRIAPPRDSVFVFYERDMMRQEPSLHRVLREKTSVPVAKIVTFDDSHTILDRDFLLMERLPGNPLSESAMADVSAVYREVGRCLEEVHRITADRYGYLGEHAPMEPQTTWVEALEIMWHKLVEDVAATGHYDKNEADILLGLFNQFRALFDRPIKPSLLHMDIWAQNILIDSEGKLTGLVDWDRALWGDPEIEFAVLDYCGVSIPSFWEGYGKPRDDSEEASIRNVFYLLYEVQKYIVIRHGRSHDPAGALRYKNHVMQVVNRCFGAG